MYVAALPGTITERQIRCICWHIRRLGKTPDEGAIKELSLLEADGEIKALMATPTPPKEPRRTSGEGVLHLRYGDRYNGI